MRKHRRVEFAVKRNDRLHASGLAGWERHYRVARAHGPARNLTRKTPKRRVRPYHVLYRDANGGDARRRLDGHSFEMFEQSWSAVPSHIPATVHDIVASQRADRHALNRHNLQLIRERKKIIPQSHKHFFLVT